MTTLNLHAGQQALALLASLRDQAPDPAAVDAAVATLRALLAQGEALTTVQRLSNRAIAQDDELREAGIAVGLRLGKLLEVLWDINHLSRAEEPPSAGAA